MNNLRPDVNLSSIKNFYSNLENLVLWARSEIIGSALDQICPWFQVSPLRLPGYGGQAAYPLGAERPV